MLVGVLITIMVAMVVGVSLVPTIASAINSAKNDANVTQITGLASLMQVLAYVFVAVILLGAVAWIGGQG